MIVIVDYGSGNLRSIQKAFKLYFKNVEISNKESIVENAQGLVLPGVGSFGDAIKQLIGLNLFNIIKEKSRNIPIFGICLGMQILFRTSEESPDFIGLGLINGEVKKLKAETMIRIPHTGWNLIYPVNEPYFKGYAYFNHKFFPDVKEQYKILAYCIHGQRIPVIIKSNNIFATQFHPEKSQRLGFEIIRWWINTFIK